MADPKKVTLPHQKINLDAAILATLDGLAHIDAKHAAKCAQHSYNKDCERLAQHIKRSYLNMSLVKREEQKLAITTLSKYLTAIRHAIRAANYKNRTLTEPRCSLPYDKTGKLRSRFTLTGLIAAFPAYEAELLALRHEPALTVGAVRHRLLKQLDNAPERPAKLINALDALVLDHELVKALSFTSDERRQLQQVNAQGLAKKATAPTRLGWADVERLIQDNLHSTTLGRQAFALALASGRRTVELIHYARFEKLDEQRVMFYGQAKKGLGITTKGYPIYLLIPTDAFLAAFAEFRTRDKIVALQTALEGLPRFERNQAINQATAGVFNSAAKLCLCDVGVAYKEHGEHWKYRVFYTSSQLEPSFKDSRAIYARVCVDRFYEVSQQHQPLMKLAFIKALLGHGETSTEDATEQAAYGADYDAVVNYDAFVVDYDAPATQSPPPVRPLNLVKANDVTETKTEKKKGSPKDPKNHNETHQASDEKPTPQALKQAQLALAKATQAIEQFLAENPHRRATGKRGGLDTYHQQVIAWAAKHPHKPITKTVLIKQIGGNRKGIEDYLMITHLHPASQTLK